MIVACWEEIYQEVTAEVHFKEVFTQKDTGFISYFMYINISSLIDIYFKIDYNKFSKRD